MDDSIIQAKNLTKIYNKGGGAEVRAVDNVTLEVARGEFVGVMGASGSGKSTLMNILGCLDKPTAGTVLLDGIDVGVLGDEDLARLRNKKIGFVFQTFNLLPRTNALENVELPLVYSDLPNVSKLARSALDAVGLTARAHHYPSELSGGEQQRVAIARALVNDPEIIFADEPTGNLDSRAADRVFQVFEALAQQGKTIVMVTHDSGLAQRTGRTVLLADGEVIDETVVKALPLLTHEQMLKATRHLEARQFEPGETIIRQGQPNDHLYLIAKGQIEVTLEHATGSEVTVARLGPGQYFGEMSLLNQGRTLAGVRAAAPEPVRIVRLGRRIFDELMAEAHAMRESIVQMTHRRTAQNDALRAQTRPSRRARGAASASV